MAGTSRLLGGGTNLVDLMRKGVERPSTLTDVTGLSGSLAATRTQWTGLASDAAAVAHAGWAARMRTQTDYAEQLAAAVDRAVTLYQEAETTVSRLWSL